MTSEFVTYSSDGTVCEKPDQQIAYTEYQYGKRTYRISKANADEHHSTLFEGEIIDDSGKRIGVMTSEGPIFGEYERALELHKAEKKHKSSRKEDLLSTSKTKQENITTYVLESDKIEPQWVTNGLNEITDEEKKIILYAANNNNYVSKTTIVHNFCMMKEHKDKPENSKVKCVSNIVERAYKRLFKRGLAKITKKDDGLIWIEICEDRIREVVAMELRKRAYACVEESAFTIGSERIVDNLSVEERFVIRKAIENIVAPYDSDVSVTLAVLAKWYSSSSYGTKAAEISMHNACLKLEAKGLISTGINENGRFITVFSQKIHSIAMTELEGCIGADETHINLIKVLCEIPTFVTGHENKAKRRAVTELPRKANAYRMNSCRKLKGVSFLTEEDKKEINTAFDFYKEEINDKIIALFNNDTGEVIGSEYPTRFTDFGKAISNLNNFDEAMDASLRRYKKAVFVTFTTDPNFTDEERAKIKRKNVIEIKQKLASHRLSKEDRFKNINKLYHVLGPDYEIKELKLKLNNNNSGFGNYSKSSVNFMKARLETLLTQKELSEKFQKIVDDPKTKKREKEIKITEIKKMNRWNYKYNPKGFKCLYDANRSFQASWNRFLQYCTKKLKRRPEYIVAYEFTETGLLHCHALIFVDYLLPNDEISREWLRCGQGEITYTYGLVKKQNKEGDYEWRWNSSRNKPDDSKGMSGGDYLRKYVKKCMLALTDKYTSPSEIQSLYWVLNKRFFSNSQDLIDKNKEDTSAETLETSKKQSFSFYGIFDREQSSQYVDKIVYHRITPGWKKSESDPPDECTAEAEAVMA